MDLGEDKDSKTEKATPKKRNDERKKGHVPLSRDAVSVASLFAGLFALRVMFTWIAAAMMEFMAYCFAQMAGRSLEISGRLFLESVAVAARSVLPIFLLIILAAVAATFAQTRFLVSFESIKPKLSKISPLQGFKRLFSVRSLVELLKNLVKISILLVIIYMSIRDLIEIAERYLYADLTSACVHLFEAIFSMVMKVSVAFLVIAAVDFFYQRWDYEKQMRMTKQEIKEEYKQTEGDPKIKGKIKQKQREMSQSRMMQQVPGADVVVRNPTHYAVALRYHSSEDEAPVVLAKGTDFLAMRIVKVAEEHNITVIENVPLARALYAKAEINSMIPPDLYNEVAEVMVYLYKLGRLKT